MQTEATVARMASVLSTYLGSTMAQSSIRAHCAKLGIGEEMSDAQLEALIAKLASGLAVFVGREKARDVVSELRSVAGGAT